MQWPAVAEAVPRLVKLLASPVAGRRLAAVSALRGFEPDDALIDALIRSSRDRDESVRAAALAAVPDSVRRLRPGWLGAIRDALEDGSPRVRNAAAWR